MGRLDKKCLLYVGCIVNVGYIVLRKKCTELWFLGKINTVLEVFEIKV